MAVAKWSQKQPPVRRLLLKLVAPAQCSGVQSLDRMDYASRVLPNDTVAPFNVLRGKWLVLPKRWGNKVVRRIAVEQQAAFESLEDRLVALTENGNIGAAKALIGDALALQVRMWQYGCCNLDANILNDTRLDDQGAMLLVDVGDIVCDRDLAIRGLKQMKRSLAHSFSIHSLYRLSPELAEYYAEHFDKVFSADRIIENWKIQLSKAE